MEAEVYFKKAVEALTLRNPNPYDGEAHYNLGLVQRFLGKNEEAYKSFYKATWNYAWKSAGYQAIAEIHCSKGELSTALKHINNCLLTNSENLIGRNLKTAILRKLGRLKEAEKLSMETSNMDKLDFWSRYELSLMRNLQGRSSEGEDLLAELKFLMRDKPEAYLDIAIEYGYAGLYDDAIGLLDTLAKNMGSDTKVYPMVYYYMGYYSLKQGEDSNGLRYFKLAENSIIDYCFSCRLESISVLKTAQKLNPQGSHAFYLLGNLYYDKRRYDEAIENWENSRKLNDTFSIVHRNLALAYFEKKKDVDAAVKSMEKAFECKNKDSRLLFELFQLYKNVNKSIEKILVLLEQHDDLVEERDDLYIGRIAFYNQLGRYDDALRLLKKRHFHPYEGGEGILTRQHTFAYLMRGREFMKKKKYAEAISEFNQAFTFPKSYGEGKRYGLPECEVNYYLGCAYEASGNIEEASKHYKQAAEEIGLFKEMDYYRSLAMIKLGNEKEARKIFEQLIKYAVSELEKEGKLGYTTNMPTVLPFEKDISIRHEIQNRYILGLGYLGLGRKIEASVEFRKVLELDINHSQSKLRLTEIES